jgi:excisionase family DNA binding protein
VLDAEQRPVKRVRSRPPEEWHVLIRDHHEGYISWEEYERNQRQLAANRRSSGPGPPREGWSLLQGLVLCGQCGRQMTVRYGNRHRTLSYECIGRRRQTGGAVCQSFGATRLERAVERLLLEALEPLGVEAMIEAAAAHARVSDAERVRWRQRVERASYETDLARRQYDKVDPANRLVASELERRWEQALRELEHIEAEAETHLSELEQPLTEAEQQRLRAYAGDLRALWEAPTTRAQEKKRIARCLIENVVVTAPDAATQIQATVHWVGGAVNAVDVARSQRGRNSCVAVPELIALVRDLAEEFTDDQIARILSRKGIKTPRGLPFTARRVTSMRGNRNLPGRGRAPLKGDDVYTVEQAAELLGVARSTVIRWIEVGLLRGTQRTSGAPWRVRVSDEDRQRLKTTEERDGWLPLKSAACALRVSQQTVLQRLKSGELEGVRVESGRRSAWRIRVPSSSCASNPDQTTLFDQKNPGDDAV